MSKGLVPLPSRGVLRVSGPDAAAFLNGILSQDVTKAGPTTAVYAALLTPQGKYLFDLFVLAPAEEVYLLDVPRVSDCLARLALYKLRAKVVLEDVSDELVVCAALDAAPCAEAVHGFADPRLPALGRRYLCAPHARANDTAEEADYLNACRALGVPDPSTDLMIEKDFALEGLFDELCGIDFQKGCYVGQEMTSRMKRRTSVKQKLCRVRLSGPSVPRDMPILAGDWEVGRMRSSHGGIGMAMIRFDRAEAALAQGQNLLADGQEVTLDPPEWLIQPITTATP